MAIIYATLIIKGKRTYKSVPERLKTEVREILVSLECEYLIEEWCWYVSNIWLNKNSKVGDWK